MVVASLPGYGFSDPPAGPVLETTVADTWSRLMGDGLGYARFGAHGGDVGAGVTTQLGLRHPERPLGIHQSALYLSPPEPWPPAVREFIEAQRRGRAEDVAYSRMQSTRPRTVAYGLSDSPAGLVASSPSMPSTSPAGPACRAVATSPPSRSRNCWPRSSARSSGRYDPPTSEGAPDPLGVGAGGRQLRQGR